MRPLRTTSTIASLTLLFCGALATPAQPQDHELAVGPEVEQRAELIAHAVPLKPVVATSAELPRILQAHTLFPFLPGIQSALPTVLSTSQPF